MWELNSNKVCLNPKPLLLIIILNIFNFISLYCNKRILIGFHVLFLLQRNAGIYTLALDYLVTLCVSCIVHEHKIKSVEFWLKTHFSLGANIKYK